MRWHGSNLLFPNKPASGQHLRNGSREVEPIVMILKVAKERDSASWESSEGAVSHSSRFNERISDSASGVLSPGRITRFETCSAAAVLVSYGRPDAHAREVVANQQACVGTAPSAARQTSLCVAGDAYMCMRPGSLRTGSVIAIRASLPCDFRRARRRGGHLTKAARRALNTMAPVTTRESSADAMAPGSWWNGCGPAAVSKAKLRVDGLAEGGRTQH